MKARKEYLVIDGMSESIWKSMVVKALRIGWVEGLQAAAERLPRSTMDGLLVCGLFEDLFPAGLRELEMEYQEIRRQDYEALCAHETHHGRGYAPVFFNMAGEAMANRMLATNFTAQIAQETSLKWINPRVFNCVYTWGRIAPKDEGVLRDPFHHPFTGVPMSVVDSHTLEGKRSGAGMTILSGHYENHLRLHRVFTEGWGWVRDQVAAEPVYKVRAKPVEEQPQGTLF